MILVLNLLSIILVLGFVIYALSMMHSDLLGAPYVPIPRKAIAPIVAQAGIRPDDVFVDLGSGDGRVLRAVATQLRIPVYGYERSWWPYAKSRILNVLVGQRSIVIRRENFFHVPLRNATYLYAYLYPELLETLACKIAAECVPGTRLVVPRFSLDLARHSSFTLVKQYHTSHIPIFVYRLTPTDS